MCHSCSFSASGQKLIVYGGEDASTNAILNDLSVLQIKPSKLWIRPAPGSGKSMNLSLSIRHLKNHLDNFRS